MRKRWRRPAHLLPLDEPQLLGKVRRRPPPELDLSNILRSTGDPAAATAWIASRQEGLVATHQFGRLGLSHQLISARHRKHGVHRVHRGVYSIGQWSLSPLGELLAASMAVGGRVGCSHLAAGRALGLTGGYLSVIDVTTNTWRRQRQGIRVHCAQLADADLWSIGQVPITSAARTLLDLATVVDLGTLEAALHRARRDRMVSESTLRTTMDRFAGHHGLAQLNFILTEERDPDFSRSRAERLLFDLIRQAGLPAPRRNQIVTGLEVDLSWPEAQLVVEFDSYTFHGDRRAFERDRHKWAMLQARGQLVIPVTWRMLKREPAWVVARISEILAQKTLETPAAG